MDVRKLKEKLSDDSGSLSLLIMALFSIIVALLLVLTNFASIAVAKRSLTQATESAAQRGIRNLDKSAYYQGKFTVLSYVIRPQDPGIPIDCSQARGDVIEALRDWQSDEVSLPRVELSEISIESLQCDGFSLEVTTRAMVRLPVVLPLFNVKEVEITSSVTTTNERNKGLYLFGHRIF